MERFLIRQTSQKDLMRRTGLLSHNSLIFIQAAVLIFIAFFLFPMQSNAADSAVPSWQGVWQGTIGTSKVTVCLAAHGKSSYKYQRYQTDIPLSQNGEEWEESDHNVVTGRWSFSAAPPSDSLIGVWHGTKNNRELPIQLKRMAVASDEPCNTEAYLAKPSSVASKITPSTIDKITYSTHHHLSSITTDNLAYPFHNIAVGGGHTLIVKTDGTLWAWGQNDQGQLGDGTTVPRITPVLIGHDYVSVFAIASQSYAIKKDGTLWAWGYHEYDKKASSLYPVMIGKGYVDIIPGLTRTFGTKADGSLWIWGQSTDSDDGSNHKYQLLQIGKPDKSGEILQNRQLEQNNKQTKGTDKEWLRKINVAGCSYTIKRDHSLWTLGGGRLYENDCYTNLNLKAPFIPTKIGDGFYRMVSSNAGLAYGIKEDGTLWAWGLGINSQGEIVNDTRITQWLPVKIGDGFVNLAVALGYAAGEKSDGTLWTWGVIPQLLGYSNARGPRLLDSKFTGFNNIYSGNNYSVAIKPDGTLWAWGRGIDQLGEQGSTVPIKVAKDIAEIIDVEDSQTYAITKNGSLWQGNLRHPSEVDEDEQLSIKLKGIKDIAEIAHSSSNCILILKKDGTLWGRGNTIDPCGFSHDDVSSEFKQVGAGLSKVAIKIDGVLGESVLGLKADGTLWDFGSAESDGSQDALDEPRQHFKIGAEFVAISSGDSRTMYVFGIKKDGTLWGWGDNSRGQLGDGTTKNRDKPVKIGADFIKVLTGDNFTVALKADGTLWAWGANDLGQVGDGTNEQRSTPVQIGTGFREISAATDHAYAIKRDGSLWFWGNPESGKLGLELPKVQMHQVMSGLAVPTNSTKNLSVNNV